MKLATSRCGSILQGLVCKTQQTCVMCMRSNRRFFSSNLADSCKNGLTTHNKLNRLSMHLFVVCCVHPSLQYCYKENIRRSSMHLFGVCCKPILAIVWLPNEDFGGRNKRWEPHFRGPLSGCEYSIWATNYWKVNKSAFHHLFISPKSSFGDHTIVLQSKAAKACKPILAILSQRKHPKIINASLCCVL